MTGPTAGPAEARRALPPLPPLPASPGGALSLAAPLHRSDAPTGGVAAAGAAAAAAEAAARRSARAAAARAAARSASSEEGTATGCDAPASPSMRSTTAAARGGPRPPGPASPAGGAGTSGASCGGAKAVAPPAAASSVAAKAASRSCAASSARAGSTWYRPGALSAAAERSALSTSVAEGAAPAPRGQAARPSSDSNALSDEGRPASAASSAARSGGALRAKAAAAAAETRAASSAAPPAGGPDPDGAAGAAGAADGGRMTASERGGGSGRAGCSAAAGGAAGGAAAARCGAGRAPDASPCATSGAEIFIALRACAPAAKTPAVSPQETQNKRHTGGSATQTRLARGLGVLAAPLDAIALARVQAALHLHFAARRGVEARVSARFSVFRPREAMSETHRCTSPARRSPPAPPPAAYRLQVPSASAYDTHG